MYLFRNQDDSFVISISNSRISDLDLGLLMIQFIKFTNFFYKLECVLIFQKIICKCKLNKSMCSNRKEFHV